MSALAPKKATAKRRRASGSSRSEDGASTKTSGPSSTGVGHAAQAPARALDLFDSGSSASDAEPTDSVPAWKHLRISSTLKTVSEPSEAFAANGMLERLLFLRLLYSWDTELLFYFLCSL
jgi:hypothetical protein